MLQAILNYFGNPTGKLYGLEHGDVAIPCGGDAGEAAGVLNRYRRANGDPPWASPKLI